jgi:peptidoglycan biosynthesis protein MviN/MurJ (putative lipid II flippase)
VVRLYLAGGRFDAAAVEGVAQALEAWLLVAVPMSTSLILARSFYADSRTWLPSFASLGCFALTLPLFWLLKEPLGPLRVPLISALTALLQMTALALLWTRAHPDRLWWSPVKLTAQLLAVGAGALALGRWIAAAPWWQHASRLELLGGLVVVGGGLVLLQWGVLAGFGVAGVRELLAQGLGKAKRVAGRLGLGVR